MAARRLDPVRARLEDIASRCLGETSLDLGDAGADTIAGQPAADEDDEAVVTRDAVAAVGERVDAELELLPFETGAAIAAPYVPPRRDAGARTIRTTTRGPRRGRTGRAARRTRRRRCPGRCRGRARRRAAGSAPATPRAPSGRGKAPFGPSLSSWRQDQPSSTIRSSAPSTSVSSSGSMCSLIVTPAVVCGTYTSTAEPAAPATASRTSQ